MRDIRALAMPDIFDKMWRDFDSFFGEISGDSTSRSFSPVIYKDINYPPMNVWVDQESKDMVLEFAVAGIPMENINIDVEGDYLHLTIDKNEEEDVKDNFKLIRKGIKTGKVKQRIYVPSSKYKTEDVKAEMRDGLLLVKVPSRDEVKPKRVQIEPAKNENGLLE